MKVFVVIFCVLALNSSFGSCVFGDTEVTDNLIANGLSPKTADRYDLTDLKPEDLMDDISTGFAWASTTIKVFIIIFIVVILVASLFVFLYFFLFH